MAAASRARYSECSALYWKGLGWMIYQIKIRGLLDQSWTNWLGDVQIDAARQNNGDMISTLTVDILDQAALFGILDHIRDINLPLISVNEQS